MDFRLSFLVLETSSYGKDQSFSEFASVQSARFRVCELCERAQNREEQNREEGEMAQTKLGGGRNRGKSREEGEKES